MRFSGILTGILLGIVIIVAVEFFGLSWPDFSIGVSEVSYRFAFLGITAETIQNVVRVLSFLLMAAVMVGIVASVVGPLGGSPRDALVMGVVLALIAVVSTGYFYSEGVLLIYGVGLGSVAVLAGGAGAGAAFRGPYGAEKFIALLAVLDALAIVIVPAVAELQVVFGLLMIIAAGKAFEKLRDVVDDMGWFWPVVFSSPVVGISLVSAMVVAPVLIPSWGTIQLALFALAFLLGLAAGRSAF